ncbi:MAG: T9SS type A sorting domain-containing protein [Bacteroidetes bacterium]|nr:T9SS type A sorting domain-containing protein [Bacteroidota bacterium]
MKKLLIILLFALSLQIRSAIIVTPVNINYSYVDCDIDLDLNGIVDFKISQPAPYTVIISCMNTNAFVQVNGGGNAVAYIVNSSIGASTWSTTSGAQMGSFYGQGIRYIGVKLIVSGLTHYGWIKIDVASNATNFSVYKFAYQDIANTTVKAGEEDVVGIFEYKAMVKDFNVFPNPLSSVGTLFFDKNILGEIFVTVFDISGRAAFKSTVKSNSIDFSEANLQKGIYFITIFEDGNYIGQKKIALF